MTLVPGQRVIVRLGDGTRARGVVVPWPEWEPLDSPDPMAEAIFVRLDSATARAFDATRCTLDKTIPG